MARAARLPTKGRGHDQTTPITSAAAGMVGGLVASWLMVQFQRRVWPPPEGDGASPTGKLARRVAGLAGVAPLSDEQARISGAAIHYVLGAGLGLAYGAAAAAEPAVAAGAGAAFGVATEVVIDQALVPALRLANPFWKCPAEWHMRGLAAHLVFGVATEATRQTCLKLSRAAMPA